MTRKCVILPNGQAIFAGHRYHVTTKSTNYLARWQRRALGYVLVESITERLDHHNNVIVTLRLRKRSQWRYGEVEVNETANLFGTSNSSNWLHDEEMTWQWRLLAPRYQPKRQPQISAEVVEEEAL